MGPLALLYNLLMGELREWGVVLLVLLLRLLQRMQGRVVLLALLLLLDLLEVVRPLERSPPLAVTTGSVATPMVLVLWS